MDILINQRILVLLKFDILYKMLYNYLAILCYIFVVYKGCCVMTSKNKRVVESVFGDVCHVENIRTEILFTFPHGEISVPDIEQAAGLRFCVTRVPDDEFYNDCHWASYGPKLSDNAANIFVVPCVIKPWMEIMLGNWGRVLKGKFVTTASGVIVLDVGDMSAWEGYELPGKRDYDFDRRRLEKSVAALNTLCV